MRVNKSMPLRIKPDYYVPYHRDKKKLQILLVKEITKYYPDDERENKKKPTKQLYAIYHSIRKRGKKIC